MTKTKTRRTTKRLLRRRPLPLEPQPRCFPPPPPPPPPGELAGSSEAEEAKPPEPAAVPVPPPEQPPAAPEQPEDAPRPPPAPALVPPAGGDSAVSHLIPGSEVRVTLDHIIEDALVVSFRLGEKLFSGVLMDLSKRTAGNSFSEDHSSIRR